MRLPPKLVRSLACLGALSLGGCSYLWTYSYRVTIDSALSAPEGTSVVMVQASDVKPLGDAQFQAKAPLAAGERSVVGEGKTCCSPVEVVYLFAFLDLDGDDVWDQDEPWGADANNPVTIDKDGYVSSIAIVAPEADVSTSARE